MADSQLQCMDDEHVNEKIPESRPEFYYSEEQRAALEQLLRHGHDAFHERLREDHAKDFLCAREVAVMRETFHVYDADGSCESALGGSEEPPSADSGVHSTYWPQKSDTEVPPLDIGWTGSGGLYRGVTRVTVHSHPPKEPGPHIKQVVRRLIQEAQKVVAVVMDLLTDLQILQDLLDASCRRGVAVYAVLEVKGVPHFLDMCARLQVNGTHLRNLRVRALGGAGLSLSFGKLPGSLTSRYMLVDGEKVLFGTYSFTWTCSRMDRSTVAVMSGQVVHFFDNDFRELYAASEEVDLYRELNVTKPPLPLLVRKPSVERVRPPPVSRSRFQVSVADLQESDLKVPAHKYHNPKYSLVFGNNVRLTSSLQDLSTVTRQNEPVDSYRDKFGERVYPRSPSSPVVAEDKDGTGSTRKNQPASGRKQLSSFRILLRGKGANQSAETIQEGPVGPQTPPPPSSKANQSGAEAEDSFEVAEKPGLLKSKSRKLSKLSQRSVSLQTINTGDQDGHKSRRRSQKKNCIQS